MSAKARKTVEYTIRPIGYVNRTDYGVEICIREEYRNGLRFLDSFSHVMVLWWPHKMTSDRYRNMLRTKPFYAKDKLTGVFATRSPYRPNPIAVTNCRIQEFFEEEGIILVQDIDAEDGTSIVDLKPYYPVLDMATDVKIADWAPEEWSQPIPEEGVGLDH